MEKRERDSLKNNLRKALKSRDPMRIAAGINLPSLSQLSSHVITGSTKGTDDESDRVVYNETLLDPSGAEWGPILNALLEATDAIRQGDAISCNVAQASLHAALNHIFGSSTGNILVPALHTVCRNTHRCAILADQAFVNQSNWRGEGKRKVQARNDHARLQSAITLLQESYSKTFNDRKEFVPSAPFGEDGSKKAGVLYIVNHLFSMYFRLNTLRLCKNLLRPVESRKLHEQGSMGERVTYRYYTGRLSMFEDQYEAAEEYLDYALRHCHKNATWNKKRILNYLIPIKLVGGRLPTTKLLEKYSLHEFIPLVNGIRTGDLRTFNEGLLKNQDLFIRRGSYLLLEKAKTLCYRNLFKRVYKIIGKPFLPLDHVAKSFRWLGMHIDLDEVECILANLIAKKYVRGYISHSKRILVLSMNNPFPITTVISTKKI